jgi:hypothetical protein
MRGTRIALAGAVRRSLHLLLLLASAALAGAAAGCLPVGGPDGPGCALEIQSVAGDSGGGLFVTGRVPFPLPPFTVINWNAAGDVNWTAELPVNDSTPARLIIPAAGGGVVALGGGAAATRLDDTGAVVWVIGYPMSPGTVSTLTSEDRVVVADATSVRLFESDASPAWARSLPDTFSLVRDVAPDASGGVWLAGTSAMPPGSVFLAHVDRDGRLLSERIWQTQSSVTVGPLFGGDPLLAYGQAVLDAVPEFGLPASTRMPGYGDEYVVMAFDASGAVIWARRNVVSRLVRDRQGNLISIDQGYTQPPGLDSDLQFRVALWDATGQQTATNTFVFPKDRQQGFVWSAGPAGAGAVIAGTYGSNGCVGSRRLFLRVRTDLTFEELPLELP